MSVVKVYRTTDSYRCN